MKKYRILYKDNFISDEIKTMIIIAETEMDAFNYFVERYSGFFFKSRVCRLGINIKGDFYDRWKTIFNN